MELKIKDRIVIRELLPEQGNLIEMMIAKSIISKVDFSPHEISEKGIKSEAGITTWDETKDIAVDISFEKAEITMLKNKVDEFDRAGRITRQLTDLCIMIKDIVSDIDYSIASR